MATSDSIGGIERNRKKRSPLATPLKERKRKNLLSEVSRFQRNRGEKQPGFFNFAPSKFVPSNDIKDPTSRELLEYWNSLPEVPAHKMIGSQVRKKVARSLQLIMIGKFYTIRKVNPETIARDGIERSCFKMKWRPSEIRETLYQTSLFYHPEYWPESKKKLPTRLTDILFNSFTHNSLFLTARFNPPKLISEKIAQLSDRSPGLTKMVKDELDLRPAPGRDVILVQGISALKKFRRRLPKDEYGKVEYWFGSDSQLLHEYISWIKEQGWITSPTVHIINPDNELFKRFIDDQEKDLGISLK